MAEFKGKSAIVSYAETKLTKSTEKTTLELFAEVGREAIKNAGLEPRDIDGILTKRLLVFPMPKISCEMVADYLMLNPTFAAEMETGGATYCSMVSHAASAIISGAAETVLCLSAGKFSPEVRGEILLNANMESEFEIVFGPSVPAMNALVATRHMHEFGTTEEQLARVAVSERKWALKNPNAVTFGKKDLTVEEVLNSRMIASPLHLFECSIPGAGAGAFIVTSAERAKRITDTPVYPLGVGECIKYGYICQAPSFTTSGAVESSKMAYHMAGVTPKDIDILQVYDAFAIHPIVFVEDLGFCDKGEGGKFYEDGRADPGGDLPTNTFGGLLSFGQAVNASGIFHVIEGVRQLMGKAGERQVKDAGIALIHGFGGMMSSHTTLILGR